MAIRAYNELYLQTAQNILGHAADFAVLTLEISPDTFGLALSVSPAAKQFARGNPRYAAGVNGCEFARIVLDEAGGSYPDAEDIMYQDRSPEYWSGWALAFFQWYADRPFMEILQAVPFSEIIGMYPRYHEMDVMHFADYMTLRMKKAYPRKRLRERRIRTGLSQSGLSDAAGVPLRQIQLFEQGQRDINKASASTLYRLSKALYCRIEDLLEPDFT